MMSLVSSMTPVVPAAVGAARGANAVRTRARVSQRVGVRCATPRSLTIRCANKKGSTEGKKWSDSTQAVHNGEREGRPRVSDCLTTPVCMTSTYWFKDTAELIAYQEGDYGSFEYGRYGNPTSRACEGTCCFRFHNPNTPFADWPYVHCLLIHRPTRD